MSEKNTTHLPAPTSLEVQILTLPSWWYTTGFKWAQKKLFAWWKQQKKILNIAIWIKYLWVPMFGIDDQVSRLISIMVRMGQIVLRGLLLLFYLILVALGMLVWLCFPFLIILLLIKQII